MGGPGSSVGVFPDVSARWSLWLRNFRNYGKKEEHWVGGEGCPGGPSGTLVSGVWVSKMVVASIYR